MVRLQSAASTDLSGSGMRSAVVTAAGARPGGRCAIITIDGSTASNVRGGSYEPAPAPTLTTERASPTASQIASRIRGSGCLVIAYVVPMLSYTGWPAAIDATPCAVSPSACPTWRKERPAATASRTTPSRCARRRRASSAAEAIACAAAANCAECRASRAPEARSCREVGMRRRVCRLAQVTVNFN